MCNRLTLDANFFAELLNNDSSIEHLMHGFVPVNNGETSVEISDTSNSQLNDSTDSQIDCSSLFIYSEDKNNENNLINDNFDEAMILDSGKYFLSLSRKLKCYFICFFFFINF